VGVGVGVGTGVPSVRPPKYGLGCVGVGAVRVSVPAVKLILP
jgi:hypothetical protein